MRSGNHRVAAEPGERFAIQVNSESRAFRECDFAVNHSQFIGDQFPAERGFAQLIRQEFDEMTVFRGSRQVRCGGNRNARFPEMGNDLESSLLCQITHSLGFGKPAHAADVVWRAGGAMALHTG